MPGPASERANLPDGRSGIADESNEFLRAWMSALSSTELTHQPVDLPLRHREALASQQRGHLPPPIHRLRCRFAFRVDPDGADRVDNDRVREVAAAGLGVFPRPIGPLDDRHALLA